MKNKRIEWIDFVKGICILAVIITHSILFINPYKVNDVNNNFMEVIRYFLSIFMMPCFFAISGYLYKPIKTIHDYTLLIYKKAISFLIPYIIFYTFFAYIFYNKVFFNVMNIKVIVTHPNGDLWFLYVLFIIFLIIGFLDLIRVNKYVQLLFFFLLLIIYLFIGQKIFPVNLRFQHAILQMFNIVFFLFGEILKYHMKFVKNDVIFISFLFIFSFLIMLNTKFYYDVQFISLNTFIPKFFSIVSIFGIASLINTNNFIFKFFDKYGRYTLIIYIAHYAPLILLERFCINYINSQVFQATIIIILVWLFSIFICYLSNHIKVINFIFYPRRYINKLFKLITYNLE